MMPKRRFGNALIFALLVIVYVACYFLLSRTSAKSVSAAGGFGFYYVPDDGTRIATNSRLQKLHYAGVVVFYPVWFIDRRFFRGPAYGGIPDAGGFEKAGINQ